MKTKLKIIIGITVIFVGAAFYFFSSSSLPRAKAPQQPGTLILRKQLVFAGFSSPEAALESVSWAFVNGNYSVAMASVFPKDEAIKEFGRNPKQFQSLSRRDAQSFKSLQILAKKTLAADTMELKYQLIQSDQTNCLVTAVQKSENGWKVNLNSSDLYTTNWDGSGDIITFAAQ